MTTSPQSFNRVRQFRSLQGLTQAELAERAGISRTAVTAIEGHRLVPSVAAALALAQALGTSVEMLFGGDAQAEHSPAWAWQPGKTAPVYWEAEVNGRRWLYPAEAIPMHTPLPDGVAGEELDSLPQTLAPRREQTVVVASCDPAAGLLASQFSQATGMRMLVLQRSSRHAIDLLQQGKIHAAGLHLSTSDAPERNLALVREVLGTGYQLLRIARWQEGIAVAPAARVRSVRGALSSKLKWIGREVGSGARLCLDRLLGQRPAPRRLARNHRSVAEAVRSGWADAGVCLQLVSSEAGLDFFPVQEEAYEFCIARESFADPLLQSLLRVVRSPEYRHLLGQLPGYNPAETGELKEYC